MTSDENIEDLKTLLDKFKKSKFLVASRSNGLICPTTMKIVDFNEAIGLNNVSVYQASLCFRTGIYLVEGDEFVNIHRQITKLFKARFLKSTNSNQTNHRGEFYQMLCVRENV